MSIVIGKKKRIKKKKEVKMAIYKPGREGSEEINPTHT